MFPVAESKRVLLLAIEKQSTAAGEILGYIIRREQAGTHADALLSVFHAKPYSTVTAIISKFVRAGLVYRTGDTVTGRSGRQQRVIRVERRQYPFPVLLERRALPPDFDENEIPEGEL